MPDELSWIDVLMRLGVAALCAGPIGWERGSKKHAAGLRTHLLVSLGSAAFIIMSLRFLPQDSPGADFQVDPFRVLQGVASGIGLLAAGAVIQSRGEVSGLTTAASVWAVAAVGSAAGFGQYDLAAILAILTFFINTALIRIDPKEKDPNRMLQLPGE